MDELEEAKAKLIEVALEYEHVEQWTERERVRNDDSLLAAIREYRQAIQTKQLEDYDRSRGR